MTRDDFNGLLEGAKLFRTWPTLGWWKHAIQTVTYRGVREDFETCQWKFVLVKSGVSMDYVEIEHLHITIDAARAEVKRLVKKKRAAMRRELAVLDALDVSKLEARR